MNKKDKEESGKYLAVTGLNIDDPKSSNSVRIEAGESLPENLTAEQIQDLLAIGAIEGK